VKVYSKISDFKIAIDELKSKGKSIGFVPTMGALHNGHLSLVNSSENQNDITVVSVFVNPTQFNNSDDLENYPRTLEQDLSLLKSTKCDLVLTPSASDVYSSDFVSTDLNLGDLETVMEGKHRPGHFDGVVNVVKRFFDIIQPDKAYFGLKDFQQVSVVKFMVSSFNLPIEIVACPTLRDSTGLAMSSRNKRLSDSEKLDSLIIHKTLLLAKEKSTLLNPIQVTNSCIDFFNSGNLKLEYFEIVDPLTLQTLTDTWVEGATACIVAFCGEVRLIDNLQLN
jgi:pantoate--beta-alanine ligase